MKIKTKLFISSATIICLIVGIITVVSFTNKQINQAAEEGKEFDEIVKNVFTLNTIANDYLLYHENRAYEQWYIQYRAIAVLLKEKQFFDQNDLANFKQLQENYQKLGLQFVVLTDVYQQRQRTPQTTEIVTPLEKQLVSELLTISRFMVDESEQLSQNNFAKRQALRAQTNTLLVVLLLLLLGAVLSIVVLLYRNIIDSMRRLQQGIKTISMGNLDYRIAINSKDEMGEFAQAFNAMTKKLQESFAILDKEKNKDEIILQSIGDGLLVTDAKGIITVSNRSAQAMLGFTANDLFGKPIVLCLKMQDEKGNLITKENRFITRVLNTRMPIIGANAYYVRGDGTPFPVSITVTPIIIGGEIEGTIEVFHDISKEKAIDKAKTEFVSIASHALRTPLGIMKWYLEAISSEGYLSQAPNLLINYLDEIYKNNERLLLLVRNLLSVSRIDQGQIRDVPQKINFQELMEQIVKDMQIFALKDYVTVSLKMQAKNVPEFTIDPVRFREVIENLISNAIKYTAPHGVVEVIVETKENQLLIHVQDHGIGISDEDKKKLFTKFFRAEKAIANNTEGSGIGLYVVKSYVKGWGGEIFVESQEGKGSTFTVSLPLPDKNKTI